MSQAPLFTHARGVARAARAWLFWLALALVAAHSMATWHAYAHSPSDASRGSSTDHQHAVSDVCGLCIAAAAIGGAAPGQSSMAVPVIGREALLPVSHVAQPVSLPHRPYAIRAPPLVHS